MSASALQAKRDAVLLIAAIFFVIVFLASFLFYSTPSHHHAESWPQPVTRQIAMILFSYATDNRGPYPDGASSTEVFQKLIDEGYCTDPGIFYLPMSGKTKALPGQRLKPENVCFDITGGATTSDSDFLPIVFTTGCKVNYAPGSAAVLLSKHEPQYITWPRTWKEWWQGQYVKRTLIPFQVTVTYANNYNSSKAFEVLDPNSSNVTIPNFIPVGFDPKGKIYRQLTPEGVLQ